jgi:hypothetical protein
MSVPPLDDGEALYLYAVTREAPGAVEGPGIDDRPVHRLRPGSFGAVVSVVPRADWDGAAADDHLEELSWVAPRAYRHETVVESVLSSSGPVYPARFGTLFSDAARLESTLDAHRDALRAYFDAVDGAQEWAVKGLLDRDRAAAHVAEAEAEPNESGTAYLQRRKRVQDAQADLDDWLDDVAEALLDALAAPARDTRVVPVRGNAGREDEVAFNWAFLVPASGAEAFREIVERRSAEHEGQGLTLDLTGPWPPYNFRPSLDVEPATDA